MVVRVQQAGSGGDDAVAVGIGIVSEGDVEAVPQLGEPGHRVGRGAVHPDLPVPIGRHLTEGRIHHVVDDRQVEAVALSDLGPEGDAGAAERMHAEPQAAGSDHFEIDDIDQVLDVRGHVVVLVHGGRLEGLLEGLAPHVRKARLEQAVRLALDGRRHLLAGGSAVRGVVLEASVLGRVVGWRRHDAVGGTAAGHAIVSEDRVGDRRRRGKAAGGVDHHVHRASGEHLEDRPELRFGQRVRVATEEQRPVNALRLPVTAHRLAHGQDVRLVERSRE